MTAEKLLEIYKAAYKEASCKEAADLPWKKKSLPKAPNPTLIPSPVYAENGMSSRQNVFPNGTTILAERAPTWTDPEHSRQIAGSPDVRDIGYGARRLTQDVAMSDLNRNLRQGVSPRVSDAYSKDGTIYNMSREAMLRRINMLKRQQARDEKIRAAAGYSD